MFVSPGDRAGRGRSSAERPYQYEKPATGFSLRCRPGVDLLILDPAGTLATGTVYLPDNPAPGDKVIVTTSQAVTTLTVTAQGSTILGAPTTIAAAARVEFRYVAEIGKWVCAAAAGAAAALATYKSGVNTTRTYDPGVSFVALDSCSLTVPASGVARVFMVSCFVNFQPVGTHGIHARFGLDGAAVDVIQAQFCQIAGETQRSGTLGPFPITVPGDSASHTLDFLVADAGATGNLVFNQRYIFAQQVS